MSGIAIIAGFITTGLFVISFIVTMTRQWDRVTRNKEAVGKLRKDVKEDVDKLEKAVDEKIPKLLGEFKDKIIEKSNSVENTVSELKGRMDGIFQWMERNGKGS